MEMLVNALTGATRRLWQTSRPLTAAGLGLLIAFALMLAGLAADPRVGCITSRSIYSSARGKREMRPGAASRGGSSRRVCS